MKSKKQNKQIPFSKKEIKTSSFFESIHKEVEILEVSEWLALTAIRNMLQTLTLTNLAKVYSRAVNMCFMQHTLFSDLYYNRQSSHFSLTACKKY